VGSSCIPGPCLERYRGALLALNGAGKSTLLKGIAGSLTPLSGVIAMPGLNSREIAYLPQAAEIDKNFPVNMFDFVAMGLWNRCGSFGGMTRGEAFCISSRAKNMRCNWPPERVAMGRASKPSRPTALIALEIAAVSLILLDEPFTAVDSRTVSDLLALVARWHEEKRTVLVVSHDLDLVCAHFPQTLLLAREEIAKGKTNAVLTAENLRKARAVVEAFDKDAQACARAG
jgi:zinc/manganese transport system ATP-binding protein